MKKYQVVFRDLEKKINQSDYPADSFLPSEGELAGQYGVSRDTIRKALSLLEKAKLIRKSQGRASLVRRQQHFNFPRLQPDQLSGISPKPTNELRNQGPLPLSSPS